MTPSEHQEAVTFAAWLALKKKQGVILKYAHITNEGKRHPIAAGMLKAEGMMPGVPDYEILFAKGGKHYMVKLELKALDGSPDKEQREWIEVLGKIDGVAAHFAYGAREAIEIVSRYL